MFVIVTGFIPFNDSTHVMQIRYHWPKARVYSDSIKAFVEAIFQPCELRINMEKVLVHPWLTDNGRLPPIERHPLSVPDAALNQNVIARMVDLGFNAQDVTEAVLKDQHDQITTTYYLLDHREKVDAERGKNVAHKKRPKHVDEARHSGSPSPSASDPEVGKKVEQKISDGGKHCVIC